MKEIIYVATPKNQWLRNFSSSLSGTILGIALTFGISTLVQHSNQVERSGKIIEYALVTFYDNYMSLDESLQVKFQEDSLLQAIHKSYRSADVKVDAGTLEMYLNLLCNRGFDPFDNSAEPMFSSSIDIWPTDENDKLIILIRDCFTLMRGARKELEKCDEIKGVFYDKFLANLDNARAKTHDDIVETLFSTEGYFPYVAGFHEYSGLLAIFRDMLDEKLDLADEEFDRLYRK